MTMPVFNITQSSAVSGGDVTADGGSPVVARGVCWSTTIHPTISDNLTNEGNGTGAFNSYITGLDPETTYYLRAYATNSTGTAYGNEQMFTTSEYVGAPVTTAAFLSACPGSAVDIPVSVTGFANIGALTLTLHYSTAVAYFAGATNNSGFPGLSINGTEQGVITVTGSATQGVTLPDNTVLFTIHFNYLGGVTDLEWFDDGASCQYRDGGFNVLNDIPTSAYYINGKINSLFEVGTPLFDLGPTSSRCQGEGNVTYTATAPNTTGITYSLDSTSIGAGNTIDPNTGTVNYMAAWSGTSVIKATASGCNGPKSSVHTVTINRFCR